VGTKGSFPGTERPGREAEHSPPSSAEVSNAWSYTSTPQYALLAQVSVKEKHRHDFTFTLYIYVVLISVCEDIRAGDTEVKLHAFSILHRGYRLILASGH
jgi:hypothetical protein